MLSMAQLDAMVREKILSRTGKEFQQVRDVYQAFWNPGSSISGADLRKHLARFQVTLSDGDFERYSASFGGSATGDIPWSAFCARVLPPDYPARPSAFAQPSASAPAKLSLTQPWYSMKSVREQPVAKHVVPRTRIDRGYDPLPVPVKGSAAPTLPAMRTLLSRKLAERVVSSLDSRQQVYALFDRPKAGLSYEPFARALRYKLALPLGDAELQELFGSYVRSSGGLVNFNSFVREVLPAGFHAGIEWQHGDEASDKGLPQDSMVDRSVGVGRSLVKSTSHEGVRQIIDAKLCERGFLASGQVGGINSGKRLRHAYLLFGRPRHGISFELFKSKLVSIGVALPETTWRSFFDRFATNGLLPFDTFARDVMLSEFPQGIDFDPVLSKMSDSNPRPAPRERSIDVTLRTIASARSARSSAPSDYSYAAGSARMRAGGRSFRLTNVATAVVGGFGPPTHRMSTRFRQLPMQKL